VVFFSKQPLGRQMKSQRGASLLETLVALVLLGIIGAAFLSALATTANARSIADEKATARILAESQTENLTKQPYKFSYDSIPIPDEYAGYTADVVVDPMRNGNIQKITVTVRHHNRDVITLESYKVNR
jgi:Tfp pilus assembly protein PilV